MVHFFKLWEAVGGPRLRGDDAFLFLRGSTVPDFEGVMVHFLKLWEAVGGPRLRGDDAFLFLRRECRFNCHRFRLCSGMLAFRLAQADPLLRTGALASNISNV